MSDLTLVKEKLGKALTNLCDIAIHIETRDKRASVGNLNFVEENVFEVKQLLRVLMEEEKNEANN